MNIKCEQIRSDFILDINYDEPLRPKELLQIAIKTLGENNCKVILFNNKKVLKYLKPQGTCEILLLSAVTYMGGNGQHPIFKKRSQLKNWYKDIVNSYENDSKCNVRFIGVYHYKGNIIFLDYEKDTFMNKKMHNSAVHVYTNDLYQAMKQGIFTRIDKNSNIIHAIKHSEFKNYLNDNAIAYDNELFRIFKEFNQTFKFGSWITAKEAIVAMHKNNWKNWKQTEWAGWYLEAMFSQFCKENHLENTISYIGDSNKKQGDLDFDLWFEKDHFYGDLKSSDIAKKEAPGNDQKNFVTCINLYDKFWYVIYEHETIKDNIDNNYEATKFRNNYLLTQGEWPKGKTFNELSYSNRMKRSVQFTKMTIIELNRINYRIVLDDFNQGHQQDGSERKPKFKINKKNIENFVVFRYKYKE